MTAVFLGVFVSGTGLSLVLYKFDWGSFRRSALFTKILYWIPIFVVFTVALYLINFRLLLLIAAVTALALTEAFSKIHQPIARIYGLIFALAFFHFYFLALAFPRLMTPLLITIAFGSALSDVTAFFAGKFLGRHHLPQFINPAKSYEGVAGQIVGALIGVLLVHWFILPTPIWLFVPIGLGAALGDLINSYVKRRLGIKDWSNAIPGHGGYLDRLSSMAGSALLTFYALILINK